MPGENLTRAEAVERAGVVAVESYEIALDLTTGPETFASATTVRFTATEGASTFVDLVAPAVRSVVLNGRELDPAAVFADSRIALDGLEADNELVVVADCGYTNTGEGLHRFVDPVDGEVYLYTQFEVPDARRVFACFEQPDLKATFQLTVTAPAAWEVVSNEPTPEPTVAQHATDSAVEAATWTFEPTGRISTYITALVAGPYAVVRSSLTSSDGREIPLGAFCRRSLSEHFDADYIFEKTRQGFEFYESTFGVPYPFTKYDQLFVPEYNMGAMENAGCVTFTESYVFRSKVTDAVRERRVVTILHELAHMWFGDLVTMKWWNDLWLNESFAEYASTLATAEATEWDAAWTTFSAMEKSWAYRQDQLPSTHPIVAEIKDLEDVQVNFDGITYAKGASVLKQLVAWVGREAFISGVSAYFAKHAWGNTELPDLLTELEATSGRDLKAWSGLWLETAGVNTLRPVVETDSHGRIMSFVVEQTAPAEWPTLRPHRLGIGFYSLSDGGELVRTRFVEVDVDGARTEVPELVELDRPALVLLNDQDLAYAKIRLDPDSLRVALEHLADIADPLARSLVWGSVWDAVRDGEVPASDYVRLVLGAVARETESTTLRTTLNQLVLAAKQYVAPAARAETLGGVGDTLWSLVGDAEPGSDTQFQLVKFFAHVASTPAHVATLSGLLDGSVALDGLEIDTDLRWELLEGLVLNGAAGDEEIDATLAADDTATGRQSAARARAAKPTVEGKLAALSSVVDSSDVPNAIIRNTGLGFLHVNDPTPLADVVQPYLDAVLKVWNERSYHIAEEIIEGFYPAPLASAELRDATRTWLDTNADAAPALRRLVVEALAGTDRALRAQSTDA
ncbi:aminopeptidase N [Promicromonospora thailandica]|uniref:Aminopeptidase N n=1 Tax=Promicromonospora thailandica TaxID=765201 RepID=A0A9X2FWX5_9MICO|nr:aminopeptidase N [Promicromonospora thailandica]MCP2262840.1 aminopeptidase N [Promicromonospora thailandica]BFF18176.1 aminopeptidase N [Promicromonospora thailandica]